jgi:MFS family permease
MIAWGPRPRGRLWSNSAFLRLWAGESASMIGDHITALAIPTAAIVLMHAGPFQVGLLAALGSLPYPVLAPAAGVWVDRLPRRPVMIASDALRLAVLASIPAAALAHRLSLTHLYVVSACSAACSAVFLAAYRSYLPTVVERRDLDEGNAKLEASHAAAHVAGPGAGGFLVQALGAPLAVAADCASFLGSIVALATIEREELVARPVPGARPGFVAEARAGLRLLLAHPVLRPLAVADGFNNLGFTIGQTVFLLFVYQALAQSPAAAGLVLAVGGIAAVVGSATAAGIARRLGRRRALGTSAALGALGWALAALALVLPPAPVLVAAMALQGFFEPIWTVNAVTIRQATVPLELQGRVHASMAGVTYGVIPLGSLVAGALGSALERGLGLGPGLAATLVIGSAAGLEAVIWVALLPARSPASEPGGAGGR